MPVGSSTTQNRMTAQARRDQLLDVTTGLVGEVGFRGVSVESVARSAGVARSLVYKHFADLPELLDAMVEREMARAQEQASRTTPSELTEGKPVELMLENLAAYFEVVQANPTTWRLVLMPPHGAPETLRARIDRGREVILTRLTGAVAPALAPPDDPPEAELTARILSAISDEYGRLLLEDPVRFTAQRLLDHARWVLERALVNDA